MERLVVWRQNLLQLYLYTRDVSLVVTVKSHFVKKDLK